MAINTRVFTHQVVICVNVFIKKEDKYIVMRRSPLKKLWPNVIQPFGGKLDIDEDIYAGAQREVREETGLQINNLRLELIAHDVHDQNSKYNGANFLAFYFSGEYESGEIHATEEGEMVIISKEELLKEELSPTLKRTIHLLFNDTHGPVISKLVFKNDDEVTEELINVCK